MNAETFCEHFATFAEAPNGVAKLRELILQLAVQGKLVPQDENDEPASDVVRRIDAARGLKTPNHDTTPAPDGLPRGWTLVRMSQIADHRLGKMLDKAKNKGELFPYLRNTNVQWWRFALEDLKEMRFVADELDEYEVRVGDLLVCEGGEPGRCAVWSDSTRRLVFQKAIHRVRPLEGISPYFLAIRLRLDALTGVLDSQFTGATIKHFTGQELARYSFPLPPLAEQRRIVGKVDQLLGLCDELAARQAAQREARSALVGATLDRLVSARSAAEFPAHAHRLRDHFDRLFDTPTTLPQLRQAIVNLAAHGQLVPQLPDELPATEMLKANRDRHRSHWEQLELARFEQQGKVPRSDSWKQAYPEPTPASDEGLPAIPSTWGWERIGLLGDDPFSAVQTGPFGSQLLKTEFVKSGVPVIAVGNLTGLGFTTDKLYFITSEKAAALARYDVQAGDVLFARSGATLGKVCVAPEYIQNWRMTGHILRARLNPLVIVPELFVLFLWGASFVTEQVTGGIRGMTRPGFNTGLLERIVLPVPPLSEQKRIVSKVTELLSLCDALEAKLTQAESASTQLLSAAVHHLLNSPHMVG